MKSQMMFYAKVVSKEDIICDKKDKIRRDSFFETNGLRRVSERIIENSYRELAQYCKRQYTNE